VTKALDLETELLDVAGILAMLRISRVRYSVNKNRVYSFAERWPSIIRYSGDGRGVSFDRKERGAKKATPVTLPLSDRTVNDIAIGELLNKRAVAYSASRTPVEIITSVDPKTGTEEVVWLRAAKPMDLNAALPVDRYRRMMTAIDLVVSDAWLLKVVRSHRTAQGVVGEVKYENLPKPGITKGELSDGTKDKLGTLLKPDEIWNRKAIIGIKVPRTKENRAGLDKIRTDLLTSEGVAEFVALAEQRVASGEKVIVRMAEESRPGGVFRSAVAVLGDRDAPAGTFDQDIATVADLRAVIVNYAFYSPLFAATADFTNSGVGEFISFAPHEFNRGRFVVKLLTTVGHDGTYRQDGIEEILTEWMVDSPFGERLGTRLDAIKPGTSIRFFASLAKASEVRAISHVWAESK
jgi:hypothetical protein